MKRCAPATEERSHVSVISLDDRRSIRAVFRKLSDPCSMDQNLRGRVFREIAKNAKLQAIVLDALAHDAELQKELLREMAKISPLRRELFAVAYGQTAAPRGSHK